MSKLMSKKSQFTVSGFLRLVTFIGMSLLTVAVFSSDSAIPSVKIGIDIGGDDYRPHTFLIITRPDGTKVEYGLGPVSRNFPDGFFGQGYIDSTEISNNERGHEAQFFSDEYVLSGNEYINLMNSIQYDIDHPPYYNVFAYDAKSSLHSHELLTGRQ